MEMSEIEWLLIQEAARDLVAESEGKPISVGEMQRDHPEGYKATREFALNFGYSVVAMSISVKQAKRIFEMIHSEDEGLSSIQEIVNMQPVNALTLAHLATLERELESKRRASGGGKAKNKRYRDVEEKVQAMWASGEYKTRVECAQKASQKFPSVSLSTAQKYLRNTPKPASWC